MSISIIEHDWFFKWLFKNIKRYSHSFAKQNLENACSKKIFAATASHKIVDEK